MKIFLLLTIFSLPSLSESHYNCLDYYHEHTSSYMLGNVSETLDYNISYKDCGYYCTINNDCLGFNYKNTIDSIECELLNNLFVIEFNLNYTYFEKNKWTCYERQTAYFTISFLIVCGFLFIMASISKLCKNNQNRISRAGYQQIL